MVRRDAIELEDDLGCETVAVVAEPKLAVAAAAPAADFGCRVEVVSGTPRILDDARLFCDFRAQVDARTHAWPAPTWAAVVAS